MKKILTLCAILLCAFWIFKSSGTPKKKQKVPFTLQAIAAQFSANPAWECDPPASSEWEEVKAALSQPYRYLGAGGQCFTFVSADDKYVVKFFKQIAFSKSLAGAPVENAHKRNKVFSAFKLSYEHLLEETGLLYVHLNPTTDLDQQLHLTDREGVVHTLALDAVEFVLQRKAELAFAAIDRFMLAGNADAAKQAIAQVLDLHFDLLEKGYRNRDPNVRSNCGFIEGKPVLIDVGRLVSGGKEKKQKDVHRIAIRFRRYLQAKHPELLPFFEQAIAQKGEP